MYIEMYNTGQFNQHGDLRFPYSSGVWGGEMWSYSEDIDW